MKNYTDLELKKELWARGYEVFEPKEFAVETLWTLDDAMDTLANINRQNNTEHHLPKEKLMQILNETLNSSYVIELIAQSLEQNIYENLFED